MIVLSCNNLNKSFGIDSILENVNFTVNEYDKIGIIGVNGTGKTTLFKIISGIYGYDSGDIYTSKDCEIGYLEQNTNFHSNNNILEEVLEVFSDLIKMEEYLRELELKIAEESTNPNSKDLDKLMNEYSNKLEAFSDMNGYGYKSEAKGVLKGLGFSDEDMVDRLVSVGIKGIWNFASIDLEVPSDVIVENVNLTESLFTLSYLMKEQEDE